jgi:hypothetical protein
MAGGHAEDVHAPGRHLHDEQDVQASEEDGVHVEEIAGQQTASLSAQERPPRGVQIPWDRPAPLARKIRRRTVASLIW